MVALELTLVVVKALTAIVILQQAVILDKGAHGAVDHQNSLRQRVSQGSGGRNGGNSCR